MLRDMIEDLEDGYINVPKEIFDGSDIGPRDVHSPAFRNWVRERVDLARQQFRDGKAYLDQLEVLRCKIVAYWYCVRFECVLDLIERDDYHLRPEYRERARMATRLQMVRTACTLTHKYYWNKIAQPMFGKRRISDRLNIAPEPWYDSS